MKFSGWAIGVLLAATVIIQIPAIPIWIAVLVGFTFSWTGLDIGQKVESLFDE